MWIDRSLVVSNPFYSDHQYSSFKITSKEDFILLMQVHLGLYLADRSWSFAYWDGTTFLAHYWCISPTFYHPQKATSTQWSATQSTTRIPPSTVICVSSRGITPLGRTLLTSQQSISAQWQTVGRLLRTPSQMTALSWIWLTPSCWGEHLTASPRVDGAWVAR